jgi:hypothetical protein
MPIELSNDMLARGCDSGCALNTSCDGRQPSKIRPPPCIRCWTSSSYRSDEQISVAETVTFSPESRMRETRLSGSMSGNRKQSHPKPD